MIKGNLMLVYFDSCALNRPHDRRDQERVAREADAMDLLRFLCNGATFDVLVSDVLFYEAQQCPDARKRRFVEGWLALASERVEWSPALSREARTLELRGFRALDALHLVSAQVGLADYFCSCDTRLLKRARRQADFPFGIVSPEELLQEILP